MALDRSPTLRFGAEVARRYFRHGMMVYAAALAFRGLLALVPLALIALSFIGLFGVESTLPRLTAALARFRTGAAETVPLEWLLSAGALVGLWSISTGARLLMRALNAAHEAEETRPALTRFAFSLVFLPALAAVLVTALALLLATTRIIGWMARWVGAGPLVDFLDGWLRYPTATALLGLAVAAIYRLGPCVRPPYRAVGAAAALTVVLGALASVGFGIAVTTVLDYGATYGGLGAAVALLVYLNLAGVVLLLGAEVCAALTRRLAERTAGGEEGGSGGSPADGRDPPSNPGD